MVNTSGDNDAIIAVGRIESTLFKKSQNKFLHNWKQRYFSVDSTTFSYWETKNDRIKGREPKFSLDISDITLIELDNTKPTRMNIVTDPKITILSNATTNSTRILATPVKSQHENPADVTTLESHSVGSTTFLNNTHESSKFITYSEEKRQLILDTRNMTLLREWLLCLSDLQIPVCIKQLQRFLTSTELSEMNVESWFQHHMNTYDNMPSEITDSGKDSDELRQGQILDPIPVSLFEESKKPVSSDSDSYDTNIVSESEQIIHTDVETSVNSTSESPGVQHLPSSEAIKEQLVVVKPEFIPLETEQSKIYPNDSKDNTCILEDSWEGEQFYSLSDDLLFV